MQNEATKRLEQALELLGYQQAKEPHHKTELLHAIRIHAEFITNSDKVKIDINVGYSQRNSGSNLEPGMVQINVGHNQRNCMGDYYE